MPSSDGKDLRDRLEDLGDDVDEVRDRVEAPDDRGMPITEVDEDGEREYEDFNQAP